MEKEFLINRPHNYYFDKTITYKNYICKDCSQKKKEYETCRDRCSPKEIPNLGYIEVSLGKFPIVVTTPVMVCPFGFNKGTNILTLQFTNYKTDSERDPVGQEAKLTVCPDDELYKYFRKSIEYYSNRTVCFEKPDEIYI